MRVGHRQALKQKKPIPKGVGFFYARLLAALTLVGMLSVPLFGVECAVPGGLPGCPCLPERAQAAKMRYW